jgi:hypothetical protein
LAGVSVSGQQRVEALVAAAVEKTKRFFVALEIHANRYALHLLGEHQFNGRLSLTFRTGGRMTLRRGTASAYVRVLDWGTQIRRDHRVGPVR